MPLRPRDQRSNEAVTIDDGAAPSATLTSAPISD
jgi:hypothetical protein